MKSSIVHFYLSPKEIVFFVSSLMPVLEIGTEKQEIKAVDIKGSSLAGKMTASIEILVDYSEFIDLKDKVFLIHELGVSTERKNRVEYARRIKAYPKEKFLDITEALNGYQIQKSKKRVLDTILSREVKELKMFRSDPHKAKDLLRYIFSSIERRIISGTFNRKVYLIEVYGYENFDLAH